MEGMTARAMALVGFALILATGILYLLSAKAGTTPYIVGLLLMAVATVQAAREKGRSVLLSVILACLVPIGWVIVAKLGIRQEVDAKSRAILRHRVANFLRYFLVIWLMFSIVGVWAILILVGRDDLTLALSTMQLGVYACSSLAMIVFAVALWKAKRWGFYGTALMYLIGPVLMAVFSDSLVSQSVSQQLLGSLGSLSILVLVWPSWSHLS